MQMESLTSLGYQIAKEFFSRTYPQEVDLFEWTWNLVKDKVLPVLANTHPARWSLKGSGVDISALAAVGEAEPLPISMAAILVTLATVYDVDQSGRVPSPEELTSTIGRYAKKFKLAGQAMEELEHTLQERLVGEQEEPKRLRHELPLSVKEKTNKTTGETREEIVKRLHDLEPLPAAEPIIAIYLNGEKLGEGSEKHEQFLKKNAGLFDILICHFEKKAIYISGKDLTKKFKTASPLERTNPYHLLYLLTKHFKPKFTKDELVNQIEQTLTHGDISSSFHQDLNRIRRNTGGLLDKRIHHDEDGKYYLDQSLIVCVIEPLRRKY